MLKIKRFWCAMLTKLLPLVMTRSLPYVLHSIETLPLKYFIDCYTGKGLSKLAIRGKAPYTKLQQRFSEITTDYFDLIQSEQSKTYVLLQKQVIKLAFTINQLISIMRVYSVTKNPELKKIMSRKGFYFQTDIPDHLVLKQFEGFIKNMEIDLKNRQQDVAGLVRAGSEDEASTRETFLNNIIYMAREGFVVHLETVSTEMYALTLRSFNTYIEAKIEAAA